MSRRRIGAASPDECDRRGAVFRRLVRIGVDRDDRQVVVHAPHGVLEEQPRADREHHVGFAPQFVAERQRDGERIAAVEHALAATETAQHGRLQHLGKQRHLRRSILRAAADHDQRIFRGTQAFDGIAQRVFVDRRLRDGQGIDGRHVSRLAPHIDRAFECGRSRPAGEHRAECFGDHARRGFGVRNERRMIDQPRDDAGLIVDLVQLPELASDIAGGNLADQCQHRRIHRVGGQQRGGRVEQSRTGHDGRSLRLAGRERRAERHIGRALFVARVDRANAIGGLEQRVEQMVVLHAR